MGYTTNVVERIDNPYWKSKIEKYHAFRLKGMNMYEAALQAHYTEGQASNAGERIEPKRELLIRDALQVVGAGNIRVAETLKDALEAKRVIYCDGDMQETEIADHKTRLDAAKLIAQVTGQLDTKTTVAVQINLPNVAMDRSTWGEE